jgi:hypothetical protein
MRKLYLIALSVAVLGSAANAQAYDPGSGTFGGERSTGGDSGFGYDFGPDRSPQRIAQVMSMMRAVCATETRSSQRQCARDKEVLDGAFARYHERRAGR